MSQVQAGADRPEPLLVANHIVKVFGTGYVRVLEQTTQTIDLGS